MCGVLLGRYFAGLRLVCLCGACLLFINPSPPPSFACVCALGRGFLSSLFATLAKAACRGGPLELGQLCSRSVSWVKQLLALGRPAL